MVSTPPLGFFAVSQYLRIDSLSCDLQNKVNIMGYGTAGIRVLSDRLHSLGNSELYAKDFTTTLSINR